MKVRKNLLALTLICSILLSMSILPISVDAADPDVSGISPEYTVWEPFNEVGNYAIDSKNWWSNSSASITDKVPDGSGLKLRRDYDAATQLQIKLTERTKHSLDADTITNGALVFYYGKEMETNVYEGLGIGLYQTEQGWKYPDYNASSGTTWYAISSYDGSFKTNSIVEDTNSSTVISHKSGDLLKNFEGGYIVVPLSAFSFNGDTVAVDALHIHIRNVTSLASKNRDFYFDNIGFVDDISKIIGSYEADSIYPVYKFSTMMGGTVKPETVVEQNNITVKELAEGTIVNLYKDNKYVKSITSSSNSVTFSNLYSGNYTVQTVQCDAETNKYGNVSAVSDLMSIEFVPEYTIVEDFGGDYLVGNNSVSSTKFSDTSNVPDGSGLVVNRTDTTVKNIYTDVIFEDVFINKDMAQNGAVVFYYDKDEIDNPTEIEKLKLEFYSQSKKCWISPDNGAIFNHRWYTISDADGSIKAQSRASADCYNLLDGFAGGYIVIPLAAFFGNSTTEFSAKDLFVEDICSVDTIRITLTNQDANATTEFNNRNLYFDNFGFCDDLSSILGEKQGIKTDNNRKYVGYTFDSGISDYPVEKLGAKTGGTLDAPTVSKNGNILEVSNIVDGKVNLYLDGKFFAVTDVQDSKAEFDITGANGIVTVQGISDGGHTKLGLIAGDIDGDMVANASDLAYLRKVLLDVTRDYNRLAANVNNDTEGIDIRDLVRLKKIIIA